MKDSDFRWVFAGGGAGGLLALAMCLIWPLVIARGQTPSQEEPEEAFFIHEFHATLLELDCSVCHSPAQEGSVELARPGHDACLLCHQDAFETEINPKICSQCHSTFPPTSNEDLLPCPLYKKQRAILFDFAHAAHVDPRGRLDPKTGFRADCTHCHQFDEKGIFASFPGHAQCASCHSRPAIKPDLTADSDTGDCRQCHVPEEIENPGFSKERRMIADHVVSGVHVNLRFSHVAHFRHKQKYNLNCTTCHYAVLTSTSLEDLTLPQMLDCVVCHQVGRDLNASLRMSNCAVCHIDTQFGSLPPTHRVDVKPPFHDERFRKNHAEAAGEPGAKCYACHPGVAPRTTAREACIDCHQVMQPASHGLRWRDNIHGKYAALDRHACATCHRTDYCVRCHNQLPRSHEPLAFFRAGAHRNLAMLDQRACMTCHTFENNCGQCHVRELRPPNQ